MALLILGGIEAMTYFVFKPTSLHYLEVFLLIWCAIAITLWLNNLFGVKPIAINQLNYLPVQLKHSDSTHKKFAVKALASLQYFILVLINVILYIVIISPHY